MYNKIAIQAVLIRQLFATSNLAQITSVVLAAILAYMQRGDIDPSVTAAWFLMVIVVAAFRTAGMSEILCVRSC